jgi:hypothetical protein
VLRNIGIEYAEAFDHVMEGNDRTSRSHSGNRFICQGLMPDPYFCIRDKSRASLSISGTSVLCFVVLIDSLYPHYLRRNSRFDFQLTPKASMS